MKKKKSEPKTVELDVRPQLRAKVEPFEMIMKAVNTLNKADTFILHATFKPTPLLGLMKVRGFINKAEKIASDHWVVTFIHKSRAKEWNEEKLVEEQEKPVQAENVSLETREDSDISAGKSYFLDNRGLEPPQPMMRTLNLLERVQSGDSVTIHNDRVPVFLIEELNALNYPYEVEQLEDGSAKVTIHKR